MEGVVLIPCAIGIVLAALALHLGRVVPTVPKAEVVTA